MKVVVPFTDLNPAVRVALEGDGISVDYCDVSADTEAYWRLMCALWAEGETFVLLEHDKVPSPGAIQAIHDCPGRWCAYRVECRAGDFASFPTLACAKFSAELIESTTRLMVEKVGGIGSMDGSPTPPRHWLHLDHAVYVWLQRTCGDVCWHPAGAVRHEHQEVTANAGS